MTNLPPDHRQSSQKTALGFDEFIAILVAFGTIGGIIFWSLSHKNDGWNLNGLLSQSSSQPSQTNILPNAENAPTQLLPTDSLKPKALPLPVIPDQKTNLESHGSNEPTAIPSPEAIIPAPVPPDVYEYSQPSTESPKAQVPSKTLIAPPEKKLTIPPPIAFNDIPNNYWGRNFINVLSSRRIIEGFPDYSFRPNQPVNRAEFAAILQKAFDKERAKTKFAFKDLPTKFWAAPAIEESIGTGFLKGYPDSTFKPDQKIPRVQVLVALVSGLNLKEPAAADRVLSVYKDAKDIPKYAIGKIAAATANGLVVNYPDTKQLAPNKEATRAEVAAMVHQALVRMGRLPKLQSPNIVRSSSTTIAKVSRGKSSQ
jgi:S-layer homology domain